MKGECVNRGQAVHYLPAKHCHPATPEPSTVYVACTTQIPLEVQVSVGDTHLCPGILGQGRSPRGNAGTCDTAVT